MLVSGRVTARLPRKNGNLGSRQAFFYGPATRLEVREAYRLLPAMDCRFTRIFSLVTYQVDIMIEIKIHYHSNLSISTYITSHSLISRVPQIVLFIIYKHTLLCCRNQKETSEKCWGAGIVISPVIGLLLHLPISTPETKLFFSNFNFNGQPDTAWQCPSFQDFSQR